VLAAALLAGLAGSPHCVLMCGGFLGACARTPRGAFAWHAGRLTTYMLLGAVAGAVGRAMPGPVWLPALVGAVLLTWFALALAGVLPEPMLRLRFVETAASKWLGRAEPVAFDRYVFGLINGLLPCGMVYAALAVPLALGTAGGGALAMLTFGLGTVPALALFASAVQRLMRHGVWPRRVLAATMLAAGLWAIAMRTERATSLTAVPAELHQHAH
jgi:sulfite exporter TauE/SafE